MLLFGGREAFKIFIAVKKLCRLCHCFANAKVNIHKTRQLIERTSF